MKKYLASAESKRNNELWFLVDAVKEEQGRELVLAEDDVKEVKICLEVMRKSPDDKAGISHRFTSIE